MSASAILKLQAVGFSAEQVTALAELIDSQASSKVDLMEVKAELKADIAAVRTELKADIAAVRTELKTDIAAVRTELKADILTIHQFDEWGIDGLNLRVIQGVRVSASVESGCGVVEWCCRLG